MMRPLLMEASILMEEICGQIRRILAEESQWGFWGSREGKWLTASAPCLISVVESRRFLLAGR